MPSSVILNYYESLVHRDDLDTLNEGCFVNDNIITFYLEYLRHTKLCHASNILLMDPAASQLLKLADEESVKLVLDPLELKSKDWIFLVVNDSASRVSSGGCHWSLCIYSPLLMHGFYFDSLDYSPNFSGARILCNKLSTFLGNSVVDIELPNVMKQNNGYDCGIFCIVFIEIICDMILKGDMSWQTGLSNDMVSHQVIHKRKSLLECINRLSRADA
ncbi:unnamed protein product [Schistosoma turkestanicum]|nr:unnamed protein product [Schistosoma turkestanicum]